MADNIKFTKEEIDNAKAFNTAFRNINQEVNELFSSLNSISDEIKGQTQGYQLANKAVNNLTGVFSKVKDIQDNISKTNLKDLKTLQDKVLAEKKNLTEAQRLLKEKAITVGLTEKEVAALANVNGLLEDQAGLYQSIDNTLSQIVANEKIIEETTGTLGALTNGFSAGLKKAGFGALEAKLGLGEALQNTKDMVAAGEGNVSKMQAAGHLAKQLGQNLTKALGPLALISIAIEQVVEAFQKIDGSAGDTAKELGISYQSARSLVGEMNSVAMASNDIMVNTENLVKAQSSLNQLMGTSVQFSGQMAEEFSSIQQRLKLSDEAMSSFTKLGLQNGKSLKENLNIVSKTTLALNNQNKISLSQKTIQEAIGKTTAATRLTLGNSTTELAKAAFQAKKLGIEIEDLSKTSSALLDFESSISAELDAELLTGRDINLERARLAALQGDQVKLGEEINRLVKEAGPDFQKNVLAQESVAKSLGLSRQELADMVENQQNLEKIRKLGFDDLNSAQEEYNKMVAAGASQSELDAKFKDAALKSQLESVSTQERLSAVTNKLQEAFIALVEPLMPVLDVLTEILEGVVKPIMMIVGPLIKELSTGLMDAFSPIKEIFSDIQGIMTDLLGDSNELSSVFTIIGKTLGALLKVVFVPLKAAINFALTGVKSLVDVVGGLVDIFQGNFSEGFHKIIEGVLTMMLKPFQFIADLAVGTINAVISGINNIPGVDINPIELDLAKTISGAIPFADGGIVNRPTNALIGEAGAEAVIPLDKLMAEFKEMRAILTQIANKEGAVYLDGTKVGTAMAMSTYKTQ
jgi:molybdenum-dependent DNA-binding transcriptional regulator ModE